MLLFPVLAHFKNFFINSHKLMPCDIWQNIRAGLVVDFLLIFKQEASVLSPSRIKFTNIDRYLTCRLEITKSLPVFAKNTRIFFHFFYTSTVTICCIVLLGNICACTDCFASYTCMFPVVYMYIISGIRDLCLGN